MKSISEKAAYEEEGITEYRFLATLDGRTCDVCGALDGKTFPVSEAKEGVNYPPLHPNDRCTTTAVIEGQNRAELKRRALDPETWKTVLIPAETTYEEWLAKLDNASEDGIIKIKSATIEAPIEQRHTGKGNPNAILQFGISLNNRQKVLLEQLPEFDSRVIVPKRSVKMSDLAALTATTGDEFAMFTRSNSRLVVRGNWQMVNIGIKDAKALAAEGYKWSGHTHPGDNLFVLFASDGDKAVLRQFAQEQSVIYNSKGEYNVYGKE